MCVVGGVGWQRRENNKSIQKPIDSQILGNKLEDGLEWIKTFITLWFSFSPQPIPSEHL